MTKPIGPLCNLDCEYCFYLEKQNLFPPSHRSWKMRPDVLERYIESYIAAQPGNLVHFAWQGGEPTLLGIPYFREVVRLQKKYAQGKQIANALQTNGVSLSEEWGHFLHAEDFLVGLSIDGPEALHNTLRKDKQGHGTWKQVMAGLAVLHRHKVAFNTLTCVHRHNSHRSETLYKFLKGIGSRHLQFIPIVERLPQARQTPHSLAAPCGPDLSDAYMLRVTPWSVRPIEYGDFLCTLFDRWVQKDVGKVFIQLFETALARWLGKSGGLCFFQETCGKNLALEHDGSVYACDHFVYPAYRLGNMMETPLAELVQSPCQQAFGEAKSTRLPSQCLQCDVRFACNGECPKKRFALDDRNQPGLNYLCSAYQRFFLHIDGPMRAMAELVRQGRPAEAIMER